MTELPEAAITEIAARMFDGDLSRQPQQVQDRVWRDATAALTAALKHLPLRSRVTPCVCPACGKPVEWDSGWSHLDGTPYCYSAIAEAVATHPVTLDGRRIDDAIERHARP